MPEHVGRTQAGGAVDESSRAIDDWWSARHATASLSVPVYARADSLRDLLELPRDEALWSDDELTALRRSALNYIEDAQDAIVAYRLQVETQLDYSSAQTPGEVLLNTYGLLQAFVLQQDAVRIIWKSLGGPARRWWADFPDLLEIRRVRNAAAGHPCDFNDRPGRGKSYQLIHRQRLSMRNFDMSTAAAEHGGYGAVKQDIMIVQQSVSIQRLLSDILALLEGGAGDSAVGWHMPWG
jgi:hypothetical protein